MLSKNAGFVKVDLVSSFLQLTKILKVKMKRRGTLSFFISTC